MTFVISQCFLLVHFQAREDAFFLADLGDIVKKYEKWMELLPRVEPFYGEWLPHRMFL